MTQWCIVAIPEDTDVVWQMSSEKIPHMTLLFLGEQDDSELAEAIALQVQHTVNTSLTSFGARVESRGVLGRDKADVLFFDQTALPKELYEFRSLLLKNDAISKAYHSAEQYPFWNPHLTMGYPEKPAKKTNSAWGPETVSFVHFNKIAFWIEEDDGPTFDIGGRRSYTQGLDSGYGEDSPAMAMSDHTDDFLSHYDDRKLPKTMPRFVGAPKPSNLKHYGVGTRRHRTYIRPVMDSLTDALEATLREQGLRHSDGGSDVIQHQAALAHHLEKAVGGRPSEKQNLRYVVATLPNNDWVISTVNTLAHTGTAETLVRPIVDGDGLISDYHIVPGNVSQDDMRRALMHFGTKGMKWGVRRKEARSLKKAARSDAKAAAKTAKADAKTSAKEAKATAKVDAKAAKIAERKRDRNDRLRRPVTDDAADAAKGRERTKKHGTDALSNDELKNLVTRMNLEQQLVNLKANEKASKARNSGRTYASDLLKDAGKTAVNQAASYAAQEAMKYAFARAGEAKDQRQNQRNQRNSTRVDQPALPPSRRALPRGRS